MKGDQRRDTEPRAPFVVANPFIVRFYEGSLLIRAVLRTNLKLRLKATYNMSMAVN